MHTPQWLTEKEVSAMTGRATQTLRNDRLKCQGFPYSKIGRSVRYRTEDIISYMDEKRVDPEAR